MEDVHIIKTTLIQKTRKEHTCYKCNKVISKHSQACLTIFTLLGDIKHTYNHYKTCK